VDVIGMTNVQEVKLAREAEICYTAIAMVTDYDCWRVEEKPVSVEEVVARLNDNARLAQEILKRLAASIPEARTCSCATALRDAILTDRSRIPPEARERLRILVDRYLS